MRITTQMIYANFNAGIQANMNAIYNDDAKISSGKKLNKPSDDPAAMSSIIIGKAQLQAFEGYQSAISGATLLLNATGTALDSLGSLIADAKQAGTNASDALPADMNQYASFLSNEIQGVIGIGNTQVGERYIFSGYTTDQPAVNATTGMYQGTSNRVSMEINSGINIDVNYAGDELIAYGPAASTRSDSGLITATAGISSPSDVYTTSGGSLNITLGAGPVTAVAIPAGSTLAAVRDAINASGTGVRAEVIDANVNGSPADYRIMLSATPGSPAADISVAVTTTDAAGTGLNRVASAAMTSVVSPDKTVIGAMSILKTAIEMGDKPAIQRSLAALDALALSVREKQSEAGVRLNRADLEKNYLTSRDTDVTNAVADKLTMSEVDIAKVTVDAQQRQTALSSLRSISSGFLQTSLFDFLK